MLYDDKFFNWVDSGALASAKIMLPVLLDAIKPRSVVDVGCGRGTWLSVWQELGINDFIGIDGDYVQRERLAIPARNFIAHDLTKQLYIDRRFDLAQCLEVAEHLPASQARGLITFLCSISDIVLFSAAQPGQGGENHINEQSLEYWAELFAECGFLRYNFLRPIFASNERIEPWYRFNSFLFANSVGQSRLPDRVLQTFLSASERAEDIGPLSWKLRRRVLRPLSVNTVSRLSRLNYRLKTLVRR